MIANKHITKIVAALMAVTVALCLCAMIFGEQIVSALGGTGVRMEYESKLFDTSTVLDVNILIADADWQSMLDNAMREEYVPCDVEVNGTKFCNVAIRPKGNTSLSSIANDPTTDRYSLKLEFDQYVEGQTCFGLDKLILNNNFADATNMKEALIYDMFSSLGVDASLSNYAKVSVNGEYWGVYLALEGVEDSFILRNYGTERGALYKPESMGMGGGDRGGDMPDMGGLNFGNMQPPERGRQGTPAEQMPGNFERPADGEMPDMGNFDPSEMFGGGKGGFGGGMFGGGGANLNYSDDELDSYSTIWEGEVTDSGKADHKRVITALKNISEGKQLEKYMDIDNLLKYAAVHIFSANSDSLSGSMAHNYYLYESDGKLNLLPWDYNLAFGGMGMRRSSGATDTVNSPIDDAWSSTNFFNAMLAEEEYHTAYYAAMQQVVDYIQNGGFDAFYTRTRSQIDELVKTDPTAFYSYDEYLTALDTLEQFVRLRSESIQGQLNGTIPSTESAQRSSNARIDASHLDLSVMGTMSMGGFGGGRNRNSNFENRNSGVSADGGIEENGNPTIANTERRATTVKATALSQTEETTEEGGFPFGGQAPEGFDPSQFGGQMPEGFDPSQFGGQMPEGFDPSQFGGQMPEGFDPSQFGGKQPPIGNEQPNENDGQTVRGDGSPYSNKAPSDGQGNTTEGVRPSRNNMPGFGNASGNGYGTQRTNGTLILYGACGIVMLAAFLFALFYRRKPRKR